MCRGGGITDRIKHVREVFGEHTCDKRSTRSQIAERYPSFDIEDGFAEADPWWKPDVREQDPELDARLRGFISRVFESDSSTYISITAHSGAINALLRVLGHRPFALQTGGVIPVVVKVTEA